MPIVFRLAAVVLLHVAIHWMLWKRQILRMNCKEGNLLISYERYQFSYSLTIINCKSVYYIRDILQLMSCFKLYMRKLHRVL